MATGVCRSFRVVPCDSTRSQTIKTLAVLSFLSFTAHNAYAARPTIWGTPTTHAAVGEPWSFTPSGRDSDGDRLIFWTWNRPRWATLDWRTGRVSGTPGPGDMGVFRNVLVGVSDSTDRDSVVWLPPFDVTVSPAGTEDHSPQISGTAPSTAVAGQPYSFTPTASDPNGDRLIFWTWNRPPWATLDWRTGRVSGQPGPADIGLYRDVLVGVSDSTDKASIVWLPPFDIDVVASAIGAATLSWITPTTRIDGSPLTNLAGYRILWGTSPGNYTSSVKLANPGLTSYVLENLAPATYYFVVVAYDSTGLESDYSNTAQKTIPQY